MINIIIQVNKSPINQSKNTFFPEGNCLNKEIEEIFAFINLDELEALKNPYRITIISVYWQFWKNWRKQV